MFFICSLRCARLKAAFDSPAKRGISALPLACGLDKFYPPKVISYGWPSPRRSIPPGRAPYSSRMGFIQPARSPRAISRRNSRSSPQHSGPATKSSWRPIAIGWSGNPRPSRLSRARAPGFVHGTGSKDAAASLCPAPADLIIADTIALSIVDLDRLTSVHSPAPAGSTYTMNTIVVKINENYSTGENPVPISRNPRVCMRR